MPAPPRDRLDSAHPVFLGSASPRRREVLSTLGLPHVTHAVDVDEATHAGEAAADYLARVVSAKLVAATELARGLGADVGVVLVADTSVIVDGDVLGKPTSTEHAEAMIARLAGRAHEVHTRFALGRAPAAERASELLHAETVRTAVHFRPLTAARVRAYVATGEGSDKAGAYAVQGIGAGLVSRIDGSYLNVVGLPACELVVALERLGMW